MDEDKAIQILEADLGFLDAREDRFIAAERLKFFPSEKAADAIIRFVRKFDKTKMDQYLLEDYVSRRKAVETLGRHKGAFRRQPVEKLLSECLHDGDPYMVEVAVWAVAEIGVADDSSILQDVMGVLDNDKVEKRVIIQTLMRASYTPALERIKALVDSLDAAASSAAMTAVAMLSPEAQSMEGVVDFLKSDDLNVRRAALEDITVSKYVPAMGEVAVCPNSLVLRSRTVRVLLDVRRQENGGMEDSLDADTAALVDRLIWDHPGDLDLLGQKKETRKARDASRNIRQLYKNDAIFAYMASKCLAEDHRESGSSQVGADVVKSYNDLGYFDYFGAYHVYKTLGWLKHAEAYDMLLENAEKLPPRFFNHQAGAVVALAELGKAEAIPVLHKVGEEATIWQLKYACLLACERLGDKGYLRSRLQSDEDWLIRARANSALDFGHLRSGFEKDGQ
ncbi:unnamed protein product [Chondrus crispus]|uniref:HEAT repeat domain-containing protein n=1 Tax=Chondrus crispus TaxID=2769 RepID=R7QBG2_CHOCR|nr:unnamed protein product [Chondrus crispus]CDF35399.1 unnamed protein product [Chondrus crispus]|eukprot:XP_005715218.1 unnamed protein product [Chondrus crispus]